MKRRPHQTLLLQVCAELGAGHISEAYIVDPGFHTDGVTCRKSIVINPAHQTMDTVVHEILHRLYPEWSEAYVRNRTSFLRNRLTDEEVQTMYAAYQKKVKRLKHPKRIED